MRVGLLAFMIGGCDTFLGPDPANTPLVNYDILWKEFDRYYSFFEYKQVNWDSLNAVHRPRADSAWMDLQLYRIVSDLVSNLKDIHVNVHTPFGSYGYEEWKEGVDRSFNRSVTYGAYLGTTLRRTGPFTHGFVADGLGYVHIPSFGGEEVDFQGIDEVLRRFIGVGGLIVDVRDNGGGSDLNSDLVAQRFLDRDRIVRYVRWRNGPAHSSFTEPIPKRLTPDGSVPHGGPVALLTNRWCFSSTESFVLAMRERPGVVQVGDTTGGGMGNPIHRELPNGWTYQLSTWIEYDASLKVYEGLGIPPDSLVTFPDSMSTFGIDPVLEKAIAILATVPSSVAGGNQ